MPLHVVVTGAGGFAGHFIAHHLSERGFSVTAIARQIPAGTRTTLAWRQADLRTPGALPERFDALIHCAAEIPARCGDPTALYRRNMDMAHNVFRSTREAGAQTAIFLSSMSVYGTISVPVVTEDTPSQSPDAYGRAKREAEDLLEAAVADGIPSALSIRLPGTVGRGSHNNFLSDALRRVLAAEPVVANNPDGLFNNIVYIGDLAAFLAEWLVHPRPGYAVTNLAAHEPLPIRDVISLLFTCSGRPEQVKFLAGGKASFLISLDRATALRYRADTVRSSVRAFVRDVLAEET